MPQLQGLPSSFKPLDSGNEPGNIDLTKQPSIPNPEGGMSTVYSRSYNIDGKEVLLPSVTPDGRFLSTDDEVINEYKKTGRHLGKFNTPEEATTFGTKLHKDYESGKYNTKGLPSSFKPIEASAPQAAEPEGQWVDDPVLGKVYRPAKKPQTEMPHLQTPMFGGYEKPIDTLIQSNTNQVGMSNLPDWLKGPYATALAAGPEVLKDVIGMFAQPEAPAASGILNIRGKFPEPAPRVSVRPQEAYGPKLLGGEVAPPKAPFTEGQFTEVYPAEQNLPVRRPGLPEPTDIQLPARMNTGKRPVDKGFLGRSNTFPVEQPSAKPTFRFNRPGVEEPVSPETKLLEPGYIAPEAQFTRPEDVVGETRIRPNLKPPEELGYESIMRKQQEMRTDLPPSFKPVEDIYHMKATGGINPETGRENIAIGPEMQGEGANRLVKVMATSLYGKERPTSVVKELLQNSFDEHREIGQDKPIRVAFNSDDLTPQTGEKSQSVTVRDYGRGLTPDQLYTKFTNLGETGKAGVEDASGGFGVAKAAPLLSGKNAEVVSVVKEGKDKVAYSFSGDKKQLMDQRNGVPLYRDVVDPSTPTGLKVTTHFPENEDLYSTKNYLKHMVERSPSITSDIHMAEVYTGGYTPYIHDWMEERGKQGKGHYIEERAKVHKRAPELPHQDTITTPGAEIKIHFNPATRENSNYNLHIQNKGLYQNTINEYYGEAIKAPSNIVANVKATVEEGEPGYPYTLNREQLDSSVTEAIRKWVKENIESGAQRNKIAEIQKIYNGMKPIAVLGTVRDPVIFDAGDKLTRAELKEFQTNPVVASVVKHLDEVINSILANVNQESWSARLEKTGLLLDKEKSYGLHVPNPETGKSAILINFIEHIAQNEGGPDIAATDTILTAMHEVAHIDPSSDYGFASFGSQLTEEELADPSAARFLESYQLHIQEQAGGNPGHGIGWLKRLGEVYETFGPKNATKAAEILTGLITDDTGGYSPEVQELLHIYQESRGRDPVTEDVLSTTGVGARDNESLGESGVYRNAGSNAGGIPPKSKFSIKDVTPGAKEPWKFTDTQGMPPTLEDIIDASRAQRTIQQKYEPKWKRLARLNAVSKSLRSTLDMSIPFRQGFGFVGRAAFWKNIVPMVRALGDDFFEASQKAVFEDPDYPLAAKSGLEFLGGPDKKSHDYFPKSPVENWFGIRNTSQMATFFTNQVRLGMWKQMTKSMSDATLGRVNPRKNMVLAEEIAQYINTYSGKGDFGRWERHVPFMNNWFYSAPLMKSRVDMMNDFINPAIYVRDSWEVRKAKIQSMFSMAAFGLMGATLAAYAGADVSLDPEDSDFLKIKNGNARLDLLGGTQQYAVAAARMIMWAYKEMNGDKIERFKTGKDIAENFLLNKVSPLVALGQHLLQGHSFGKKNLNIPKEIESIFIPMVTEDTLNLIQDDPANLWMAPFGGLGMGVQVYDKENPLPEWEDDADEFIRSVLGGLGQQLQ